VLQQALQTVVFYKVNAEGKDGGEALADEFTVKGYPTFVMASVEGETIQRWWGFDSTPDFLAVFKEAMRDPTSIAEKKARFESQPTARDAGTLGEYYLTLKDVAEAVAYLEQAIELGETEEAHEVNLVLAKSIGVGQEIFTVEDVKAAADRALRSPHISDTQTVDVARWTIRVLKEENPAAAAPYIEAGLLATEGKEDEDLQKGRQSLLISQALMVKGDKELALRLKRETLSEGWEEDSRKLNGFARWCFENEVNLEEAEALARKGVELAKDDDRRAMILDTVAEIVNRRGDAAGAAALIQEAMELDPDNEHYTEQFERFTRAELEDVTRAEPPASFVEEPEYQVGPFLTG
jgi:tetratricopeptide (TPR) repeat protein